jgi:tetratricopeptide (TPR) repeat protein
VRITAQLIDAGTGYHLFSETYDRRIADVFELQDEIARAIVGLVRDRVFPERSAAAMWEARMDRLASFLETKQPSLEARALYTRAVHEYDKWTPEALRRGIELLERSLAEEPDFAPAHAALSRAYGFLASAGHMDVDTVWRTADAAARRAVELDPGLGDGHIALGMSMLFYRWDSDAAYEHIQKGIGLNPGSAIARQAFGVYLIVIGEPARAVEEMEMASRLDPLSMLMLYSLAWAYMEAERYQEAIDVCDRILAADPMFRAAYDGKGYALMRLGRLEEAARLFERVVAITGDPYKGLAPRGHVFALMGRTDDARRALAMLHERARDHPEQSLEMDFAVVHAALAEHDAVYRWLEAGARKHLAQVLFSVNTPLWKELRRDPHYWEVIARYGLMGIARDAPQARPVPSGG